MRERLILTMTVRHGQERERGGEFGEGCEAGTGSSH